MAVQFGENDMYYSHDMTNALECCQKLTSMASVKRELNIVFM